MTDQALDHRIVVAVATCAIAIPTAALVYWLSWKSYDVVPLKYQYVPGTITGWMSKFLDRYSQQRPVRIYLDGCFDLMHYGHANALRQAKTLGDVLVVGICSDEEINRYKGPPVLNDGERASLVEAVKWVDEVIPKAPYILSKDFIDKLFHDHKIDYIVHGDDPCLLPDGSDAYDYPKKISRFRMVKRTEGVSTTDIVGRMLMCGKVNRMVRATMNDEHVRMTNLFSSATLDQDSQEGGQPRADVRVSRFLPTSRRIVQFANGMPAPAGARVIYIDGGFDLFHCGHLAILQAAHKEGNFLLVGVHSDEEVQARRGPHLPIMSVHERSLSIMAINIVNEVIIGAPAMITDDLIKTFNISLVVRGSVSETTGFKQQDASRYQQAKDAGIYKELESPSDMTTKTIIRRIILNQQAYEERQAKKVKSEATYYSTSKEYVNER